jgi:hypothetical protein
MSGKLNATGTIASERVHLREIVVISRLKGGAGGSMAFT